MPATLRILLTLVAKDFRLELRNREIVVSVVLFAALVIAIFAISVGTTRQLANVVGPGVLWAGFAFSAVVGVARSAAHEHDGGATPLVLLAPISHELVWLGKTVGNAAFLGASLLAIIVLYGVFYDALALRWEILAVAVLLVVGMSGVGTLFAAMTAKARARESLLPMLFLPLISPLLFAAVEVTSAALTGGGWSEYGPWLLIALAYDGVFVTASALLYPQAVVE